MLVVHIGTYFFVYKQAVHKLFPAIFQFLKEVVNKMNSERASHPSGAQVDALINWLERKPSLAKGFAKTPSGRLAASREWDRITLRLNSMGKTQKTKKQWIKYWADKKSGVKKKATALAAFASNTGSVKHESDMPSQLTNIEERILVLMGGEGFVSGNPFQYIQNDYSGDCLSPAATEAEVTTTADPIRPNNDSFTINIRIPQQTAAVKKEQESEGSSSPTEQPLSPSPQTTRPSLSRLTSPTLSRRRILQGIRRRTQVSPSSQRRNSLLDMTDKFLQIEHRRLEIDNRIVTVMERNSERDHLLVEATKSMGEGLKAMAEGLKALAEAIKR
ncbi:uncharacterized protein LOC118275882 isoform X1 [Spodoptera frugiperda]|uniref:Regulatory protein zeste n=2 Tax=Spodoptera frugiperda TaxID=7108 RepID=A0A9R0EQS8_SPOFR|nr:uncharacterized protein LOC118275882 isoform X1 [Spodoptera frugiperda]